MDFPAPDRDEASASEGGGKAGLLFAMAVALVGLMGLLALYAGNRAAVETEWVTHTQVVIETLEVAAQHLDNVEIGARAFAATGDEHFLEQYQQQGLIRDDLGSLCRLTTDNPQQQGRLKLLQPEVAKALSFAEQIVAARRQGRSVLGPSGFRTSEALTETARSIMRDMQSEERLLLDQRGSKAKATARRTALVTVAGTFTSVFFLLVAAGSIGRQIRAKEEARAQVQGMNADLERRVEQGSGELTGQAEELASQTDELLRSRKALETQTLMLQSVLDSMAEGLVAADEEGKFVIWNTAAQKILGLGPTQLPSQKWTEHYGLYLADMITPFPTDQLPMVRAIQGEASTAEMFVRNPKVDAGTWIEASGCPLKDQDGALRGGVVAFRDISQRRADEQQIRRLNEELEERVMQRTAQLEAANKELEAFTYSVSHDLRAPLRHISGFSRILDEEYGAALPADAQRHLQRIQEGTRRMGQLVDELLSLAQMGRQIISLQVTELDSVVKDVVSMLEPETQQREVEWKIGSLPCVECDATLIRQVFQNLISNALKYSRPRSPAIIEIGQTTQNGQTVIFVRDNGVGFNMKYADKLFGVFQRLHRAEDFEGTGIGLATVQRIVHKHGGRIWAEAELDKGATFYVTLGGAQETESKTQAATAGESHE